MKSLLKGRVERVFVYRLDGLIGRYLVYLLAAGPGAEVSDQVIESLRRWDRCYHNNEVSESLLRASHDLDTHHRQCPREYH